MRSLIVVAAVVIFGQTAAQAQAGDVEIKSFPVLAAPGGRYVFGQISSFRRDQFLLDTQTGRVWTAANIGTKEKENIVFVPM